MEALPITTDAPMQSPVAWAYPILTPTLKFLLRSPLHGVLSRGAMIIIFEGRKSGRRYDVVVAYFEEGGKIYTFSGSNWSKNFIGGAPVALRLRGTLVRATATVVDDLELVGRVIQRLVRERGEKFAVSLGLIGYSSEGVARLQMPKNSRMVEFTVME